MVSIVCSADRAGNGRLSYIVCSPDRAGSVGYHALFAHLIGLVVSVIMHCLLT